MTTFAYNGANLRAPTEYDLRLAPNSAFLQSPLTGVVQTVARPGERWLYTVTWKAIKGAERADILGFFAQGNGGEHRFRMPFFGWTNRGAFGGTPVVDGAGQTGSTIAIRGCDLSVTNWVRRGDIVRFSNEISVVTADADSDGTGDISISIMPRIRTSPDDGETLRTNTDTGGLWILTSPVDFSASALNRQGSELISDLTLEFADDLGAGAL